MHEASLRQALGAAIIAAVAGVVSLALGAFIAPIPTQTSASQVVTALFVRGILALLALALALAIAYFVGFRIEMIGKQASAPSLPKPDPSASSSIVSLFTTPGTRRDAVFAGAIVTAAYWLITTLYILALGKTVGNVGVAAGDIGSYLTSHLAQGLVFVAAGMGCGGLGSRTALAREMTRRAFMGPVISPALPPSAADPSSPPDPATPPS